MSQVKKLLKVGGGEEQAAGFQSPRSTKDSTGRLGPHHRSKEGEWRHREVK